MHALLAADVALDRTGRYAAWNAVVPSAAALLPSLPLTWPAALQGQLPGRARALLAKQVAKHRRDYQQAAEAFPGLEEAAYAHAWLLVNTRTFYHVTPRTEHLGRDDRMALQPVADLFNHGGEGCGVSFDEGGFAVRADRAYARGDEVRICYGRHSNDFLLVEYGFVMDGGGPDDGGNRWDEVCLDDAVLPRLSARQRALLDARGFLGGYVLDAETVCYRTEVAVRLLCMSSVRAWSRFVDGADNGVDSQAEFDALLRELLVEYRDDVARRIDDIARLDVGEEVQRQLLRTRWRQVLQLVTSTIKRLEVEASSSSPSLSSPSSS